MLWELSHLFIQQILVDGSEYSCLQGAAVVLGCWGRGVNKIPLGMAGFEDRNTDYSEALPMGTTFNSVLREGLSEEVTLWLGPVQ